MWALLLAAAVTAQPASRLLFVQAGEAAVTCTAHDAAGWPVPERLTGGGPWTWKPEAADTVSCSASGYEPIEIDAARAEPGRALAVELLPARMVTFEADWTAAQAWIEWRALTEGGTARLARQSARVDGPLTVPVAHAARVIRVFPVGSAPLSVLVPEGPAAFTLRLPALRPGGELFVRWPVQTFMPAALEATMGAAKHTIAAGPVPGFRAAVLAPGTYAVVPRYRGGGRGARLRAVVRAGETTELFPPARPEPGAVAVSLAPEVCRRADLPLSLQLHPVAPGGTEVSEAVIFEDTLAEPPCRREVEGLSAGDYEAQIVRGGDSPETLSASRFTVLAGQRAEVALSPSVRVAGRVAFADDTPAGGLTLRFSSGGRTWNARTDLSGQYAAVLGGPGDYEVTLRAADAAASASFTRALQAGAQREDFRLGETRLTVRLRGSGGKPLEEAAQLVLTTTAGRRITGAYAAGEEEEAQFVGLDHGRYTLTARTASGLTSLGAATVSLTAREPEVQVEIAMGRHQGRLVVVDEAGRPVARAAASAGGRDLEPAGDGAFPLADVAVGEWLNVRAEGYTPVCRVLQAQDLTEARITLVQPTEGVTLHAPPQLAWQDARLRGLPGSDCPVEIHALGVSLQMEADRTSLALRLPRGRFELLLGESASPLVAPGEDVVLR